MSNGPFATAGHGVEGEHILPRTVAFQRVAIAGGLIRLAILPAGRVRTR